MADLDNCGPCAASLDGVNGPVVGLAKQRTYRDRKHILAAPNRYMHDHPEVVAEGRPGFRRLDKIDGRAHPLLLDPESRDLQETCGIDTGDAAADRGSTPAINFNGVSRLDLDGI